MGKDEEIIGVFGFKSGRTRIISFGFICLGILIGADRNSDARHWNLLQDSYSSQEISSASYRVFVGHSQGTTSMILVSSIDLDYALLY